MTAEWGQRRVCDPQSGTLCQLQPCSSWSELAQHSGHGLSSTGGCSGGILAACPGQSHALTARGKRWRGPCCILACVNVPADSLGVLWGSALSTSGH